MLNTPESYDKTFFLLANQSLRTVKSLQPVSEVFLFLVDKSCTPSVPDIHLEYPLHWFQDLNSFILFTVFLTTPSSSQGLLLALCAGITPDRLREPCQESNMISHMQDKWPIHFGSHSAVLRDHDWWAWGTTEGARDQTWNGNMQGKLPICYTIFPDQDL